MSSTKSICYEKKSMKNPSDGYVNRGDNQKKREKSAWC